MQAEGADLPMREILANEAGGDAFGDGAFEPDSPLRGILGGGGFLHISMPSATEGTAKARRSQGCGNV